MYGYNYMAMMLASTIACVCLYVICICIILICCYIIIHACANKQVASGSYLSPLFPLHQKDIELKVPSTIHRSPFTAGEMGV